MSVKDDMHQSVIKNLSAVGAIKEAQFYAHLFSEQPAERFAFMIIDARCLKNPLLDALVNNLRILASLNLTPVLLIGLFEENITEIKFQAQRLFSALQAASILTTKLNIDSYGLMSEIRQKTQLGHAIVLEWSFDSIPTRLNQFIRTISPAKVIFLQPSGGLNQTGRRLSVINIDQDIAGLDLTEFSPAQNRFLKLAEQAMCRESITATYIIASPLNLLAELFTTHGSGTFIRRGISILNVRYWRQIDKPCLKNSLEQAFERTLSPDFFKGRLHKAFIEKEYRGGAIFKLLNGHVFLSKFWVTQIAQGEGAGRDIWQHMCEYVPAFCWRSRLNNPFNAWYFQACDGMQVMGKWRLFWKGLQLANMVDLCTLIADLPEDFL